MFFHVCPFCGTDDSCRLSLATWDFDCDHCGNEFAVAKVENHSADWTAILEWMERGNGVVQYYVIHVEDGKMKTGPYSCLREAELAFTGNQDFIVDHRGVHRKVPRRQEELGSDKPKA